MENDTFVRITNKDIWCLLNTFKNENSIEHNVITQKQNITNGKVKAHMKFIYAIVGGLATLAGWFVLHLMNG